MIRPRPLIRISRLLYCRLISPSESVTSPGKPDMAAASILADILTSNSAGCIWRFCCGNCHRTAPVISALPCTSSSNNPLADSTLKRGSSITAVISAKSPRAIIASATSATSSLRLTVSLVPLISIPFSVASLKVTSIVVPASFVPSILSPILASVMG